MTIVSVEKQLNPRKADREASGWRRRPNKDETKHQENQTVTYAHALQQNGNKTPGRNEISNKLYKIFNISK